MAAPSPLGSYAIFCDDIRGEANGKAFLIGVYQDDMYVNGEAPWVLPQFYVRVVFRTPEVGAPPKLRFRLKAINESGETDIWKLDHPGFEDAPNAERLPFEKDISRSHITVFNIAITPFIIEKPSRLEVLAEVNGVETMIDRLRVRPTPST